MTLSRREFLASLAGLAALSVSSDATPAPLPADIYGLAGRVFSSTDGAILDDHAVLVRHGMIEDVAVAASVTDRPVLTFQDATILPGVINAHCHRLYSSENRRRRWLEHGVTSIGDVGAPLSAMPELANSPTGETATAAFTGPMFAPPGGYPLPVHNPEYALVVQSLHEGKTAVKMLADRGASMIKLAFEPGPMPQPWPTLDTATAGTVSSEARRLGLTVRCHVEDVFGLSHALDAGVDTVEHVPHRWIHDGEYRPVLTEDGDIVPEYFALLKRMVREDVTLTPTLDVLTRSLWNGPSLFEPVRIFHKLGGKLAVGNDYPYRRTDAGMVTGEMRLLAKAGLDNADILCAATLGSATACGFANRGVIAPGKAADLLVVNGNPLDDLDGMKAPLHIVKDGVFIR